MRSMILAAGLGTRLRPLTDLRPKPAVPLFHRPMAWYALDHFARCGASEVVVSKFHLGGRLALHHPDVKVEYSLEPELLGTAGGIRRALGDCRDEEGAVVMNGDIFFAPDLVGALARHRESGALATMVLRREPNVEAIGAVRVDPSGRVRRIRGPAEAGLESFVFTGVHVLSKRAIASLPEMGCIVQQAYLPWLEAGERIAAFVDDGPWRDLGSPAALFDAHMDLLSGALNWPGVDAAREAIDATAQVAEARECVVGRGAIVRAPIVRCVVWPETRIEAPIHDAIVTPHAVVTRDGAVVTR